MKSKTGKRSFSIILYNYVYQLKKAWNLKKPLWPCLKYLQAYFKTNKDSKNNPLLLELPWITFGSVQQLEDLLKPSMKGFEFGSGGSTLFLSHRISVVHSVEHDKNWHSILNDHLQEQKISNVNLTLIEPEFGKVSGYSTKYGKEWVDYNFKKYVESILSFPDEYFEFISIDGRARNACLKLAWPKLKKGGILLFDNGDRDGYKESTDFLKPYLISKIYGPTVGYLSFMETHLYKK
jgi:hypothetical protein